MLLMLTRKTAILPNKGYGITLLDFCEVSAHFSSNFTSSSDETIGTDLNHSILLNLTWIAIMVPSGSGSF